MHQWSDLNIIQGEIECTGGEQDQKWGETRKKIDNGAKYQSKKELCKLLLSTYRTVGEIRIKIKMAN